MANMTETEKYLFDLNGFLIVRGVLSPTEVIPNRTLTLNPQPQPQTLNPRPQIPNPRTYTPSPRHKPQTLKPEPRTPNPSLNLNCKT